MFENPKVIAALVAGIVSLIVSGIAGLYALMKNRKRFDDLKKELLLKSSIERFLDKKEPFLNAYREFESELNILNDNNPNDGTVAVQHTIDFYAKKGRDFYLRNKSMLESKQLDSLQEKITRIINSGTLNTPENHSEKREFGQDILSFLSELNDQTLNIK
jgi:hypothetical protein